MIRCTIAAAAALAVAGMALAKLPPLDEAAKAKAAEAAAKTAWQGKLDAYQLCKAQDRVAAAYRKTAASRSRTATASPPARVAPPGPGGCRRCPQCLLLLPRPSHRASTPEARQRRHAAPTWPGCADPGPFAYNAPPEQKPLETSGAHSPGRQCHQPAEREARRRPTMTPSKPGVATK
jgi:hypothetical protein